MPEAHNTKGHVPMEFFVAGVSPWTFAQTFGQRARGPLCLRARIYWLPRQPRLEHAIRALHVAITGAMAEFERSASRREFGQACAMHVRREEIW